jgi:pimeloyl-ACP methyl ester carboxylesterase
MGGAVALLAAAAEPGLVERLVLVSPAGLPLRKPIHRSAANFATQVLRGLYPLRTAARGTTALMRAPRAALRLAEVIRSLDLREECRVIRARRIPALVVGCKTDTLVRCDLSRSLAESLGADYVEVDSPGGHMWMLNERKRFASILSG